MSQLNIKLSIIAIILLSGAILNSCKDSLGLDQRIETPLKVPVKPLNIGNYWEYKVISYNERAEIIDESYQRYEIIAEITINGEKWYIEDKGLPSPGISETITNRENGLWTEKGSPEFNPDSPIRIISYPIIPGEKYLVSRFTSKPDNSIREVIREATNINISIKTPAGNFKCIEYYDFQADILGNILTEPTNISYYAPNYGLIERKSYRIDKTGNVYLYQIWQLDTYNIIPSEE